MRPTSRTRLFALLGDPVTHSLSPTIQNAAFLAAGIDATYVAIAVTPDAIESVMRTLTANGGGGNVTIPHKQVAAAIGAKPSERVQRLGAANVSGPDGNGSMQIDNTDVDGVLAAHRAIGAPAGPWLILGTGGSARAVAGAALEAGVPVAVRSRDAARATEFEAWAHSIGLPLSGREECTVCINATPLGLKDDDKAPLDLAELRDITGVIDLTYAARGESRWIAACREQGITGVDGREVLLAQGAASWSLWFPGVTPPVEVMRAAIDGRLG